MESQEIARVFDEIGDLLELTEDNPYRAKAYYRGAQMLRENPDCPLNDHKALLELPGIGESLAEQISELAQSGKSAYVDELRSKVPEGFRKLLHIPGMGSKTIRLILKEIKPVNLKELLKAIEDRRVREIKGLSSKTEGKLKRGIETLNNTPENFGLGIALPFAREIIAFLEKLPEVCKAAVVGSVCRGREVVRDLDILVSTDQPDRVISCLLAHPKIEKAIEHKKDLLRAKTWFGMYVDLHLTPPEDYQGALQHYRGASGHHDRLRELAAAKGLNWDDIPRDAYSILDLPELPSELRESGCALEIPEGLLERKDMLGDLHMHTRWSDGGYTIKEMADKAAELGYEYIAICDHSQNLPIAKGLNEERLLEQGKEIEKINLELKGKIKILKGAETDILKDGRLDFPDEILAGLDVAVGSIHFRYKQNKEQMTERIELALKNPHLDILAHPTGRLINRRDPFAVDLERVFQVAAENKKALEINASPTRMDLKDEYAAKAKDFGVLLSIDTDAHSIEELDDMEYGVATARRGGLLKSDVLNTRSLRDLDMWLKN